MSNAVATSYSIVDDIEFDAVVILTPTPAAKYPGKTHARKLAAELRTRHNITSGLVYLEGEKSALLRDSDQPVPFRQRRYFYYLAGVDFADCYVTYDIGKDELLVWVPFREPKKILWNGRIPTPAECLDEVDVDDVRYVKLMDAYMRAASGPVYVLHADESPSFARSSANTTVLLPCLNAARVLKTDAEVTLLRRAAIISSTAHKKVAANLRRLSNEREIEAIFSAACTASGAKRQAYPIIAGSGRNASTLHYEENNAALPKPDGLVLLDAGCEVSCYAADITRTMPINGTFSPAAAKIYALVERMQTECIALVKPGVVFSQIHNHAVTVAAHGLHQLKILTSPSVTLARAFFPHGLGHHVGLECHDVNESRPLAPGMVITIEPGIYFCRSYIEGYFANSPGINWPLLETYFDVGGVRIEDMLLVTETGHDVLSTAPKGKELFDIISGKSH